MRLKGKAKEILGLMRAKIFGITAGQSVYIGKHCSLKGKHHITLEDCVTVRPYAQIWSGGTVRIGKGSEIGERCRISIANSLEIGEKVLLSPNVYITDGEGSYIGINAVIVGNVRIGRHCVVGANSVVTKDVPDYCVAVGSPAKVIKNMKN